MFSRTNQLILGLAVLAAIIGGIAEHRQQQPAQTPSALIGRSLPAITLADLDGQMHALSDYRGHRVLLNLWASWCAPCLREMPALQKAQDNFGEHGGIVVGIAMDEAVRVRRFLAVHPVSYPILLGHQGADDTSIKLGNSLQVLPYSLLIDADGSILATHEGPLSDTMLKQWLNDPAEPH
jgi:peroxiredoxin